MCKLHSQLVIYPHILNVLGLRWSLRLFLIAFAISCVLLPFSNQITGPIGNSSNVLLNGTNETNLRIDFCGAPLNSSLLSLNENSIKRIPISVWATVGITNALGLLSRWVYRLRSCSDYLLTNWSFRISASTVLVVMLSNAAVPDTRSTINGLASSGINIAFAIGPLLGTQTFSWSQQNGRPHLKTVQLDLINVSILFSKMIVLITEQSPSTSFKEHSTKQRKQNHLKGFTTVWRWFSASLSTSDSWSMCDETV